MRKSLVMLLASLTLALGLCPAFAFAANDAEGGLSTQSGENYTVNVVNGSNDGQTQTITGLDAGSVTTLERAASINGKVFAGWFEGDSTTPLEDADAADGFQYRVNGNATVTAKWNDAETQTVTFSTKNTDPAVRFGGKDATDDTYYLAVQKGQAIDYSLVPATWGYTTDGWYAAGSDTAFGTTAVDKDVTLTGKWSKGTFKVSYNANGGEGTMADQTMTFEEKIGGTGTDKDDPKKLTISENAFTREGYAFVGWATTSNAQAGEDTYKPKAKISSTNFGADITLYAVWKPAWKITLSGNGHGSDATVYQLKGEPVAATGQYPPYYAMNGTNDALVGESKGLDDFVQDIQGYDFTGFYTDAACTKPYATYNPATTEPGAAASWTYYKADSTKAEAEDDYQKFTADTTLYAGWQIHQYTVTFDPAMGENQIAYGDDDATWYPNQTVNYGATASEPTVPYAKVDKKATNKLLNQGYTLEWVGTDGKKWDFSTKLTDQNTAKETRTLALKAKWTAKEYTIKFDKNNADATGTVADKTKVTYDAEKVALPENKYKLDGYDFKGWATTPNAIAPEFDDGFAFVSGDEAKTTDIAFSNFANENADGTAITLYAVWQQAPSYKIAYDAAGGNFFEEKDGKHVATGTLLYQYVNLQDAKATVRDFDAVPGLKNVERTGYTIAELFTAANPFKDEAADEPELKSGVEVAPEEYTNVTAKDGDTPITYYAGWLPNTYTIKYSINGETATNTTKDEKIDDQKIIYNNSKAVEVAKNVWKVTGKKFTGWNTLENGKGIAFAAGDEISNTAIDDSLADGKGLVIDTDEEDATTRTLTLYAQWANATYTVSFDALGGSLKSGATAPTGRTISYTATADKIELPKASDIYQLAGYTAEGWVTSPSAIGGEAVYDDKIKYLAKEVGTTDEADDTAAVEDDITLYPNWKATDETKYMAQFFSEDGTELIAAYPVEPQADPTSVYNAATPTKAADEQGTYAFKGWAVDVTEEVEGENVTTRTSIYSTGTTLNEKVKAMLVAGAQINLYPEFTVTLADYKVNFVCESPANAVMPASQTVKYGNPMNVVTDPTAEGYEFSGWFSDKELTKAVSLTVAPIIKEDTTFYAKFTPDAKKQEDAKKTATAADEFLSKAVVSEAGDGSDVATDKDWVTADQKKALDDAAKAVADAKGSDLTAAQIEALNAAYAAATANGKGSDATKAAADEKKLDEAKTALDAVDALKQDIKDGKSELTEDELAALDAAVRAYEDADPKTVADVDALKAAVETAQAQAQTNAEDKAEAQKVADMIKALPEASAATDATKADADAAKAAYDKLSDAQKKLVGDEAAKKLEDVSKAADAAADKAAAEADVKAAEDAVKAAEDAQAKADEAAKTAEASKKAADEAAKSGDLAKAAEAAAKAQKDAEAAETAAKAAETAAMAAQDAAKTAADSAAKANNDDLKAKAAAAQTAAGKAAETAAASVKTATDNVSAAKKAAADAQKKADDAKKSTAKKANPMKAKAKTVKAKASKKTTIKKAKAFTVTKAQGKVTFKKTKGNKKITVKSNGKVVVKKGLKKGKTYKVKVKVTAKGNANYKSATKTVTLKVKVK